MLSSQIALIPLKNGWTTASGASFSTSSWFFSVAQRRHRRPWHRKRPPGTELASWP
jgi:hypothetical protein